MVQCNILQEMVTAGLGVYTHLWGYLSQTQQYLEENDSISDTPWYLWLCDLLEDPATQHLTIDVVHTHTHRFLCSSNSLNFFLTHTFSLWQKREQQEVKMWKIQCVSTKKCCHADHRIVYHPSTPLLPSLPPPLPLPHQLPQSPPHLPALPLPL